MDTHQIRAILEHDYMTKDVFRGVYAIDQLPSYQPGMYVINTDERDEPGEHWLAVYNKEFFDSYGNPPMDNRIVKFLGPDYTYNAVPLQQELSNACGFYCVYYLLQRARGHCAEDIIELLKYSDSDFVVKHMIYDRYKPLFY